MTYLLTGGISESWRDEFRATTLVFFAAQGTCSMTIYPDIMVLFIHDWLHHVTNSLRKQLT